jgi:hypothetical protein
MSDVNVTVTEDVVQIAVPETTAGHKAAAGAAAHAGLAIVSAAAPAAPAADQLWYDKTAKVLKRWTGAAWETSGSDTYLAGEENSSRGSGALLLRVLDIGWESAVLSLNGDSTTDGTGEALYLLGQALGDRYDPLTVGHALWDDGTQAYGTPTMVQQGDGAGPTIFHDAFARADGAAGTADSGQTWSSGTITSGALTATGIVDVFQPDVDVQATINPATAGGNRITVRRKDSSNHVFVDFSATSMTIFKRVAGSATNLGSTTISIANGTPETVTVKARGPYIEATCDGQTLSVTLSIADVIAMSASGLMSTSLEFICATNGTFDDIVVKSAPTLTIFNGSHGGANAAYHYDGVRFPKIVPLRPTLAIVSLSHNEGGASNGTSWSGLATLCALVQSTYSGTPMLLTIQNPKADPADEWRQLGHYRRANQIANYARQNNYGVADVMRAMIDNDPTLAAYVSGDGTHPTTAGAELWRDEYLRALGMPA